jgi:hypothetical protein
MFATRAKRRVTSTSIIRSWMHESGRYRVAEVKSTLGLPTLVLAIERLRNGSEIVRSRHRKKSAAFKAVEQFR